MPTSGVSSALRDEGVLVGLVAHETVEIEVVGLWPDVGVMQCCEDIEQYPLATAHTAAAPEEVKLSTRREHRHKRVQAPDLMGEGFQLRIVMRSKPTRQARVVVQGDRAEHDEVRYGDSWTKQVQQFYCGDRRRQMRAVRVAMSGDHRQWRIGSDADLAGALPLDQPAGPRIGMSSRAPGTDLAQTDRSESVDHRDQVASP
jgi:hypothetical protein